MKYARIFENVALEIFTPQEGFTLADSFHPDIAAQFEEVPDEVTPNSTKNPDGSWSIFVQVEEPTPAEPADGEVQQAPSVAT